MAKKKTEDKGRSRQLIWIAGVAVALVTVAGLTGRLNIFTGSSQGGRSFMITERETRPVLAPDMFTGRVRAAYAAAKKYRDVFNEVFCYCYCDQPPFNHRTLLSCFTGRHGAG